jgi:hypothetical protein
MSWFKFNTSGRNTAWSTAGSTQETGRACWVMLRYRSRRHRRRPRVRSPTQDLPDPSYARLFTFLIPYYLSFQVVVLPVYLTVGWDDVLYTQLYPEVLLPLHDCTAVLTHITSTQSPLTVHHPHQAHCFTFSSKYLTNFSATLFSSQSTRPFSTVPSVIAFLCTVTNARLWRCSSESVSVRAGSAIRTVLDARSAIELEVEADKTVSLV